MTYEPHRIDDGGYVDATDDDPDLIADLEALAQLGLVAPVVRGDGELGIAAVSEPDDD